MTSEYHPITYLSPPTPVSMGDWWFDIATEDHFWIRRRFDVMRRLADAVLRNSRSTAEIGCGHGLLQKKIEDYSGIPVTGFDLNEVALQKNVSRLSPVYCYDIHQRNPEFSAHFDLLLLFDVLEHIQEERETLLSLRELLVPGGFLLLTVPAHQYLWSHFDVAAQHCRRYSTSEIRDKMVQAGFKVDFISQSMACIFPLMWIFRKLRGFRKQSDLVDAKALANEEFRVVPIVNGILNALLNLEAWWLSKGFRLPIGTSLVLVCRRPT